MVTLFACIAPWYSISAETELKETTEYYQLFYTYTHEKCKTNDCFNLVNNVQFWQLTDDSKFTRGVFLVSWICSFFALSLLFLALSDKTAFFVPLAFISIVIGVGAFYSLPLAVTKDSDGVCNHQGPCESLYGSHSYPLNIGSTWWSTSYGFAFAYISTLFCFVITVLSCLCSCCCSKKKKKNSQNYYVGNVSISNQDHNGPKVYTVVDYQPESIPLMGISDKPQSNPNFDYIQVAPSRFDPNVIVR